MSDRPSSEEPAPGAAGSLLRQTDLLASCVHCGFCLEVCPTYQLTGDENNSPRGRLRLWREEAEGRLAEDPWTERYTAECVGCLACETACPANVPYGEILEQVRHEHVSSGRAAVPWRLRLAAALAARPRLFQWSLLPLRVLRRLRAAPHRLLFAGRPAVGQSTAAYARQLMQRNRPTGPRVALLTGCLMEALFREINFATVRVLVENNVQVIVPAGQGCCGAFQEHLGLSGLESLRAKNRQAFHLPDLDAVLTNSSGCGLALSKSLRGTGTFAGDPRPKSEGLQSGGLQTEGQAQPFRAPVRDVLEFLGAMQLVARQRPASVARVYVDLPCHLIHGQRVEGIPANVLDATGYRWQLAPGASDCCGSGGVYNLRKPDNAREILQRKSSFLNQAEGDPVILASSNHVCLMQWNSARSLGLVQRPYQVRHVIQLLDPEPAIPGML